MKLTADGCEIHADNHKIPEHVRMQSPWKGVRILRGDWSSTTAHFSIVYLIFTSSPEKRYYS